MGDPEEKSYSPVCVPQTGKCSIHMGVPYIPTGPHFLVPNPLPSSETSGPPFPTPLYHSPSIAAVPTKQGVIGTLQEIEVPFGSQRPQRKHITHVETLWTHAPIARPWARLCGPHAPDGGSLAALAPPLSLWVDTLQGAQRQVVSAQCPPCVDGPSGCSRGTDRRIVRVCMHMATTHLRRAP